MNSYTEGASVVAEVLGLDGLFSFPEKLLQQLWHRREFQTRGAVTADGRAIEVLHPGKWNQLGGPDFLGARLRVGGVRLNGDVELHLREPDWAAHGHAKDPAYDQVVLHVVLFPTKERMTRGANGREIPILALLPLLFHGLEEYAAEAAIEQLANRPSVQIMQRLGALPRPQLSALLQAHARSRWEQKVRFAGTRIERLGWDAACHQTAMEILGYRFNRVPMLRLAAARPLAAWGGGQVDADAAYAELADEWSVQGVRPANQPRTRLRQYAAWTCGRPDWPDRLLRWAEVLRKEQFERSPERVVPVRRLWGMTVLRKDLASGICGDAVGGTRLDNLVCDGFLPLLAAGRPGWAGSLRALWDEWYPGDVPPMLSRGLRDLGVIGGTAAPASHGAMQGLLGWVLAEESAALQGRRGPAVSPGG